MNDNESTYNNVLLFYNESIRLAYLTNKYIFIYIHIYKLLLLILIKDRKQENYLKNSFYEKKKENTEIY